jgi:hypothetical protein
VVNENHVISFPDSHMVTWFSVPQSLVFDNAKYFSSLKLNEYALENNIKIKYIEKLLSSRERSSRIHKQKPNRDT